MKIEISVLMDNNEMLSHVFFGCIPTTKLAIIRDKYIGKIDWEKERTTIPVEMKIGGVSVNPKEFFDRWKTQMNRMILEKAKEVVSEKLGSVKIRDMINKLNDYEQILEHWESEINWDIKNPLIEDNN